MSTTEDYEGTAKFYATGGANKSKREQFKAGKLPAIIFRARMGMVDRGAEIAWLSMYPQEKEVTQPRARGSDTSADGLCSAAVATATAAAAAAAHLLLVARCQIAFPPLTTMEIRESSVDGAVVIYDVVYAVNLHLQTIEQVIARRQKVVRDMKVQMQVGLSGVMGRAVCCDPRDASRFGGALDVRSASTLRCPSGTIEIDRTRWPSTHA